MSETINREQVLTRLCALGSAVQRHLGYQYAADCFCGGNKLSTREAAGPFRWDSEVVDFIETAVRKRIQAALSQTSTEHGDEL